MTSRTFVRRPLLALALVTLLAAGSPAAAKQIYLKGSSGYDIQGSQVVLRADRVVNDRPGGQSGTLKFILWATPAKYKGGTIRGHEIASFTRPPLKGGFHYSNVSERVPLVTPPAGKYWMTLTVSEYDHGVYRILDWAGFPKTHSFGPAAAGKTFGFEGRVSYRNANGTLTLECEKITNRRGARSGPLLLRLWATNKPYRGGKITGYIVGQVKADPLKAGFDYRGFRQSAPSALPPPGSYHATVTLEENRGAGYTIVDYSAMDGRFVVR